MAWEASGARTGCAATRPADTDLRRSESAFRRWRHVGVVSLHVTFCADLARQLTNRIRLTQIEHVCVSR